MHPDNSRVDLTADAMELSSDLSEDDLKQSHKCDIPARYTLVALSFCGFFCLFALRVNLSVAIVAMVNYSAIAPPVSNSSSYDLCPVAYANTTIRPKVRLMVFCQMFKQLARCCCFLCRSTNENHHLLYSPVGL